MRKLLASEKGFRKKFHAVFRRFGRKVNYHGYSDETILLVRVTDAETNTVVADHIWFSLTKGFEKLNLKPGMKVEFEARIKSYRKGYVNRSSNLDHRTMDYKLSNPTRIAVIDDQ
jgi:hypothetical protein